MAEEDGKRRRRGGGLSAEDLALWESVAAQVAPLDKWDIAVPEPEPPAAAAGGNSATATITPTRVADSPVAIDSAAAATAVDRMRSGANTYVVDPMDLKQQERIRVKTRVSQ